MAKLSRSPKTMGLVSGNARSRSTAPNVCKISRPKNEMRKKNLPSTGGTGLDDYVLDVMKLG